MRDWCHWSKKKQSADNLLTLVTLSLLTLPATIFSAPAPAPAEGGILGHASDRTKSIDFTVRGVNDGDIDIDGGEVRFVNVPGGSSSAV
ncbi:MAG: hypothetical protein Q9199_006397 [Rusavskia elegans]